MSTNYTHITPTLVLGDQPEDMDAETAPSPERAVEVILAGGPAVVATSAEAISTLRLLGVTPDDARDRVQGIIHGSDDPELPVAP